jgi:ER-bound oxygenase mpaB/B'/Rubber oxygenase, catalytic domain
MHLLALRAAAQNGHSTIALSPIAMTITVFGFMGYALVRPHLLDIKHASRENREGFIHLWAVIGYMLGIKDEFNMCLYPVEVVEM